MAPQNAFSLAGPVSLELYKQLLMALKPLGRFQEEVKKTSIHLVHSTAFAGVAPRKQHLILTIKAERPIHSSRVFKAEQASRNRWYLQVKLADKQEIDRELLGWLKSSYELCA